MSENDSRGQKGVVNGQDRSDEEDSEQERQKERVKKGGSKLFL